MWDTVLWQKVWPGLPASFHDMEGKWVQSEFLFDLVIIFIFNRIEPRKKQESWWWSSHMLVCTLPMLGKWLIASASIMWKVWIVTNFCVHLILSSSFLSSSTFSGSSVYYPPQILWSLLPLSSPLSRSDHKRMQSVSESNLNALLFDVMIGS